MTRLPTPGSDNGSWGSLLNDFLTTAHNPDGTLKDTGLMAAKADDDTVVHTAGSETITGSKTFSTSPLVPTPTTNTQAANKSYVDSTTAAGAPDATTTTKGILQLTNDLGGTATAPTVPGLAGKYTKPGSGIPGSDLAANTITDSNISSSAAIARTKLDSSSQTSLSKADTSLQSLTAADGTITVAGTATAPTVGVNTIPESKVTNLTTDLSAINTTLSTKATDSSVVHKTGDTMTGTLITPSLQITGGAPASGKVLTSDTTGNATWATAASAVTSVAGKTGAVTLGEADITNLSTDLAATEKTATKDQANGYAGLDGAGLLKTSELPSTVVSMSGLPATSGQVPLSNGTTNNIATWGTPPSGPAGPAGPTGATGPTGPTTAPTWATGLTCIPGTRVTEYGTEFISLSTFTSTVAPHLDAVNWLMVGSLKNSIVADYDFTAALSGVIADQGASLTGVGTSGGVLTTTNTADHTFHTAMTVVDAIHTVKIAANTNGLYYLALKYVDDSNVLFVMVNTRDQGSGAQVQLYTLLAGGFTVLSTPATIGASVGWLVARQAGNVVTTEWWTTDPHLSTAQLPGTVIRTTITLTGTAATVFGAGVAGHPGLRCTSSTAGGISLDDWTVATVAPNAYQMRGNF